MEIKDTFRVPLAVDDAWKVLLDVERIAPCLPGAKLEEIVDDEYRGYVKVKLGAVQQQYKGVAIFESVDEASHTFVLAASGRETRGQGHASASITGHLTPAGDETDVSIETDLKITGRAAQFGRGVLAEVSKNLLNQFADCLQTQLRTESVSDDEGATGTAGVSGDGPEAVSPGRVAATRLDEEPEAIDILEVAGAPVAKRAVPILIAILAVVIVIWRCGRSKRG